MLTKLNHFLEKILPLLTPSSIVIGVLLGDRIAHFAFLVIYLFAFMTLTGSLNSRFSDLRRVFTRPLPMCMTLVVLHLIMPMIAWLVGHLLFQDDPYVITGLILGCVIPAGVASFIWVSMYKGNIGLTLTVILIDSFLSPLIVPASMYLFVGAKVNMNAWGMIQGLFWMIVLPSIVGMTLNQVADGRINRVFKDKLAPFSKIALGVVIALNGAVVGPYLKHPTMQVVELGLVVLLIASVGYPIGLLIGKLFGWEAGTVVSLTFNGGMRNISAGAVIAISYFPSPVAIPVILGMLFQQSLAACYGLVLKRFILINTSNTIQNINVSC